MRTFLGLIIGLVLGTTGMAHAAGTHADERLLAPWMHNTCATEDSANCHRTDGTRSGDFYARTMPGTGGVVCRIFVYRPGKDYCRRG